MLLLEHGSAELGHVNRQSRSQWYRFSQWKSRILTKLVTGGLYNTQSQHSTKWAPVCTLGGHQGALLFLLYKKWMLQIRHLWVSKKNMSWWPERGPKGRPKGCQKKIGSGSFSILQGPWKVFYHLVSAWPRGECAHSDFFLTLSISQNMFIFHGKNAKSSGRSQICMKTGSTNFGHFWTWKIHCFVDVFKTMGVSRYSKLVVF